jgi:iron complex transport system substrate-binding protein
MKAAWLALLLCGQLLAPSAAAVGVRDDAGAAVTLARPAQRIVSLAPHVTEMLYAAGAGDRLVGAVQFSDYPEAAKRLPRVGSYTAFDLEAILALRPDLVVGWQSGNPGHQLERLRKLGLPVFVSEPRRIPDIPDTIERLGVLAGSEAVARRAGAEFRANYRRLLETYSRRPAVAVFYQIWNQPVMTVGGEHPIDGVLRLCGARNVFSRLPALTPTVETEAVLAADPDAIIASGMNSERPPWLDDWRRWPQLRAVRYGNLFFIPPDLIQRPGPRILLGAAMICEAVERARANRGGE